MLNEKGQSLLEVIVVVALTALVIAALVFATIVSLRNASFAKNQTQATKLAQEGLERVRTGRDRNRLISIIGVTAIDSWSNAGSIWNYHISGNCDRPDLTPVGLCYFNIDSTGQLRNIIFASTVFPSISEGIPSDDPVFRRVIVLSDDLNHDKNFKNDDYQNQKEVTAIVKWTDFAGEHESKLTTILGKL